MGQHRSDDGSNLKLAADELAFRSRAFDALLSYANDAWKARLHWFRD